jgi:hypothetical protein
LTGVAGRGSRRRATVNATPTAERGRTTAYEDFHANRLAALPGVAAVTSYVTMKSLSADTT